MLTIQKANARAIDFYTAKCKYTMDEISPSKARLCLWQLGLMGRPFCRLPLFHHHHHGMCGCSAGKCER